MMRTEKGITLIALVITIIVMLILVAVTITIAVNGGLFNYARNASVDTNGAIENEQKLGNGTVTVNGKSEADINTVVDYYANGTEY